MNDKTTPAFTVNTVVEYLRGAIIALQKAAEHNEHVQLRADRLIYDIGDLIL
jgi:hypothetical protein